MLLTCGRMKRRRSLLFLLLLIVISGALFLGYLVLYSRLTTVHFQQLTVLASNDSRHYEEILTQWEQAIIPNLGENGVAAYLEEPEAGEEALKKYALNTVLSDRMPLVRHLRDPRHKQCSNVTSPPLTLTASVVVIFYNELRSVILRTVSSVLRETPAQHLHEIILVDDCSTDDSLGGVLDYYLETRLRGQPVRLLRLRKRMGLIRARLEGARNATGDVLVFLDAHCEATVHWLEPLLAEIQTNRSTVAVPIIDVIEANTLAYSTNGDTNFQVGGFSWSGHFTWIDVSAVGTAPTAASSTALPLSSSSRRSSSIVAPVASPTMAGGLFAIHRHYFWEVGSYDEQMDGWGGENLEMSFRVWQCGGRLLTVPCSRVGHVFRDFHPYSFPGGRDTHALNTARLALVWMDDYARFFFMHHVGLEQQPSGAAGFAGTGALVGDVTHRRQLRAKLRCHSFAWYLRHVYPGKFVPDENVHAHGQVRTEFAMCLDDLQLADDKIGPLGLYQCHPHVAISQYFSLSGGGELRKEDMCAETYLRGGGSSSSSNNRSGGGGGRRFSHATDTVQLTACHGRRREQLWILYRNGSVYHPWTRRCLSSGDVRSGGAVHVERCADSVYQRWRFTHVNLTAVRE